MDTGQPQALRVIAMCQTGVETHLTCLPSCKVGAILKAVSLSCSSGGLRGIFGRCGWQRYVAGFALGGSMSEGHKQDGCP